MGLEILAENVETVNEVARNGAHYLITVGLAVLAPVMVVILYYAPNPFSRKPTYEGERNEFKL